jgi:integrin beta 3
MKAAGISVEAENVACSGSISENMNFLPSFATELTSCTKSLTIKFNDNAGQQRIIKLKQGGFVTLDGLEVSKLPKVLSNGAVTIRQASSSFVIGESFRFVQNFFPISKSLNSLQLISLMELRYGGMAQRERT